MDAAPLSAFNDVVGQIISVALALVGLAAVVMFVLAGIQFISAGADKEGAAKARNTLTFAIIGLILAVSAWMIITIFGQFLGIQNIGVFNICWGAGC